MAICDLGFVHLCINYSDVPWNWELWKYKIHRVARLINAEYHNNFSYIDIFIRLLSLRRAAVDPTVPHGQSIVMNSHWHITWNHTFCIATQPSLYVPVWWCQYIFCCIICAVFQRVECLLTHSLPLQRDNKENATTRAMKKHNSDDLQHLKTGRTKLTASRKVLHTQNWLNWIICVLQHIPSFSCYIICLQNFCVWCVCVVLGLVDASISVSCFNPLAPTMFYTYHNMTVKIDGSI
jgi:hypothetical protein